ncbi:hypothetical protein B0A50_06778 [Salinomyces thailandicus]|uniref:NUDE domain-containing protein n=1 Tax=Salinomyces thailandicus TaxID=706561 RepID=A0A4U0TQE2_9PEZI|nr:hypothetical protein B0A50_06778 [Salinomyces thailandica]
MTSSPLRPGASREEELDYYKKQYEQLETDLADFQSSSKELEEQLERDIEIAEKNERKLREQVEKVNFEVEEWKQKHKQAKTEANSAHNALEKEVTALREGKRQLELRLRDIEVVNDDYERQARNTESSLEDMESKYNVTIERGVMLEEEVKVGEQERESLRIEAQRLRDELGDLKIENEITLEKLRLANATIERLRSRKPSPLAVENLRARSPSSEVSGVTPSSPTMSTPPPKSDSMSDAPTPPSPPLSDAPTNVKPEAKTPMPRKRRSLIPDLAATPKPSLHGPRPAPKGHARDPSTVSSTGTSAASEARSMRPPTSRARIARPSNGASENLPRSDSLYQIKALRGRMQKIEERVHSARSKLPAPGARTPTGSPRAAGDLPGSVTMRRSVRGPRSSQASSLANGESAADHAPSETSPVRRESHMKRLSYGPSRPASQAADRPPSSLGRPTSRAERPSSRAGDGGARPSSRTSLASSQRPSSCSGARTTMSSRASFGASTAGAGPSRPRSSMCGTYATMHSTPRTGTHRPSTSISELRRKATESEDSAVGTPLSRRITIEKTGMTALPAPSGGPGSLARKHSDGFGALPQTPSTASKTLRRTGTFEKEREAGMGSEMRPPPSRRKMSDVGETY